MFVHTVLFEIKPGEVPAYRKDSLMWAGFARKAKGFVAYRTMKRFGFTGQYASVYEWKTKQDHDRFMKKFHDWLVGKSKAKVKVLGYYNVKAIDSVS
ncbi:MAG: hypothetical protein WC695_02520 [Candidatus Omnitrophota bacterium]|jgi:hypothetical protein